MNNNAKARVAALRSGEYKKGTGALRSPGDHFCCLGVACELYAKAHPDVGYYQGGNTYGIIKPMSEGMPIEAREWLNINNEYASASGELADINDRREVDGRQVFTFEQVADYIEANADKIFKD
jgi:hypothetical protein